MRLVPSCLVPLVLLACSAPSLSAPAPVAPPPPAASLDFSGTYACQGDDSHEGPYTATVTLRKVPAHSQGRFAAYALTMDVPGYGTYLGHVTADGREAAVHFALTDPIPQDHGTGLARFTLGKEGRWRFSKYYYEPDFKGGNHGTETCVQQSS